MSERIAWTDEVSDHVMDAQVIAMRAVREDGVVTPTEQRLLASLRAAQETITAVDRELMDEVRETKALAAQLEGASTRLVQISSHIRTGKRPRRMTPAMTTDDDPQAA